MNQVQVRAERRLAGIASASKRIQKKIKDMPNDSRVSAWKKRLTEYKSSIPLLEIELKHGRPFLLKGAPSSDGVAVSPPTGAINSKKG